MIESNMRTYLANSTAVTSTQFYLRVATQSATFPYGVVFKVSPGKDYTHDGDGLSVSRLQCSCFSTTYHGAKSMAAEVITAMEEWPTKTTSTTSTGVQTVFLEGEVDLFEDDKNVFHTALDFFVWHAQ